MAGNVVTGEMVEELLISGADIVKFQITQLPEDKQNIFILIDLMI